LTSHDCGSGNTVLVLVTASRPLSMQKVRSGEAGKAGREKRGRSVCRITAHNPSAPFAGSKQHTWVVSCRPPQSSVANFLDLDLAFGAVDVNDDQKYCAGIQSGIFALRKYIPLLHDLISKETCLCMAGLCCVLFFFLIEECLLSSNLSKRMIAPPFSLHSPPSHLPPPLLKVICPPTPVPFFLI